MTQTIILPADVTAAQTADIDVAANAVITLSIFPAVEGARLSDSLAVQHVLPVGVDVLGVLDSNRRTVQVCGPCTVRVVRPALDNAYGVAKEA